MRPRRCRALHRRSREPPRAAPGSVRRPRWHRGRQGARLPQEVVSTECRWHVGRHEPTRRENARRVKVVHAHEAIGVLRAGTEGRAADATVHPRAFAGPLQGSGHENLGSRRSRRNSGAGDRAAVPHARRSSSTAACAGNLPRARRGRCLVRVRIRAERVRIRMPRTGAEGLAADTTVHPRACAGPFTRPCPPWHPTPHACPRPHCRGPRP